MFLNDHTLAAVTANDPGAHLWDFADPGHPHPLSILSASDPFAVLYGSRAGDTLVGSTTFTAIPVLTLADGDDGILLADIEPDRIHDYLCSISGQSITEDQWRRYLPDQLTVNPAPGARLDMVRVIPGHYPG